jgi:regulator of replication initiation timing
MSELEDRLDKIGEQLAQTAAQSEQINQMTDALIAKYFAERAAHESRIYDLQEQINAQAYVIGALKTQVEDAQQAGMQMQIEREQLKAELQTYIWEVEARKANGDSWRDALDKIMAAAGVEWWEGEPPADEVIAKIDELKDQVRQKLYPEYERLTAENEKLRKLLDWALHPEAHAALMAAYANAGKAVEGMDSNIPY